MNSSARAYAIKKNSTLIFLSSVLLGFLGFAIYCSTLLIPLILAALASTSLPLPQALVSFIAVLPLLVLVLGVMETLRYLHNSYTEDFYWFYLVQRRKELLQPDKSKGSGRNFVKRVEWYDEAIQERNNKLGKDFAERNLGFVLALLAGLPFGIYLATKILPEVIAILATKGLSYSLAVCLGGVVAGLALIILSIMLIAFPSWGAVLWEKCWVNIQKMREGKYSASFSLLSIAGGLGFATYLSYIIYPLLLNSLTLFASSGLAVFTSLAVCVGLLIFLPYLANRLVWFIFPKDSSNKYEQSPDLEDYEGAVFPSYEGIELPSPKVRSFDLGEFKSKKEGREYEQLKNAVFAEGGVERELKKLYEEASDPQRHSYAL